MALEVGLAYAVANALFGGPAEYLARRLKSLGHQTAFYWYVAGIMAITII
jgi:MFS transporter, MHS family, dicarboxylic acid transporter PcaT